MSKKPLNDYAYFKDVAKYQVNLTPDEEEKLFNEYLVLEKQFKTTLLSNHRAITYLVNLFEETKQKGKSVAKLNAEFDNKKIGHNQKIIDRMNKQFDSLSLSSNPNVIANGLYNMGFSKETYSKVYKHCQKHLPTVQAVKLGHIQAKTKEIESKLTCSMLMMAISIAQKYTNNMFGMDIKDAIQEVTIGIYEAINLYDITKKSNGNRIKFSTYANIKAEKKIKEQIMKTSRLIRLPKSRLEALFIVLRVCTDLDEIDIQTITLKANAILEKRKKRPLKASEFLTEEKVLECMELLNNSYIRLDSPVEGWNDGVNEVKTFSDIIPDTQLTPEDNLIKNSGRGAIVNFLKLYLDPLLYTIVDLRFLSDVPQTYDEVADFLYKMGHTKKRISKENVRQKENIAIQKLLAKDTKGELKELLLNNL